MKVKLSFSLFAHIARSSKKSINAGQLRRDQNKFILNVYSFAFEIKKIARWNSIASHVLVYSLFPPFSNSEFIGPLISSFLHNDKLFSFSFNLSPFGKAQQDKLFAGSREILNVLLTQSVEITTTKFKTLLTMKRRSAKKSLQHTTNAAVLDYW